MRDRHRVRRRALSARRCWLPDRCVRRQLDAIRGLECVRETIEAEVEHAIDGIECLLPLGIVGRLCVEAHDEFRENARLIAGGRLNVPGRSSQASMARSANEQTEPGSGPLISSS